MNKIREDWWKKSRDRKIDTTDSVEWRGWSD